jgi:hypothetical protein
MLAVEHWYTSGAFWGAAGVVAVVVVGVATILVMLQGTRRRRLRYATPTVTPLLGTAPGLERSDLKITYDDQDLHDPHFLTIRLENPGSRDIRSTDFDKGKPLIFDVNARVVTVLSSSEPLQDLGVESADRRLYLGPTLIKGHQVIRIDLLVDGPKPLLTCEDSLIDVTVQEQKRDDVEPYWMRWTNGIAYVVGVVLVVSIIFGHPPAWLIYGGCTVVGAMFVLIIVSIVRAVRRELR